MNTEHRKSSNTSVLEMTEKFYFIWRKLHNSVLIPKARVFPHKFLYLQCFTLSKFFLIRITSLYHHFLTDLYPLLLSQVPLSNKVSDTWLVMVKTRCKEELTLERQCKHKNKFTFHILQSIYCSFLLIVYVMSN